MVTETKYWKLYCPNHFEIFKKLNAIKETEEKHNTTKTPIVFIQIHPDSCQVFLHFPLTWKENNTTYGNKNINHTTPPPMEKTRRSLQTGAIHPCIPVVCSLRNHTIVFKSSEGESKPQVWIQKITRWYWV